MMKTLQIMSASLFFFILIIVVAQKYMLKSIRYESYATNIESMYDTESVQKFDHSDLSNLFEKKILNLEDLIRKSTYFVKIKVHNKVIYGNGILNQAEILECYKGDFQKGEEIEIYDSGTIDYFYLSHFYAGTTPLKENIEYYVFLKKALKPNKKGTYVFSSLAYGYYTQNKETKILFDYDSIQQPITLKEASSYDFISVAENNNYTYSTETNEKITLDQNQYELYFQIKDEILQNYH